MAASTRDTPLIRETVGHLRHHVGRRHAPRDSSANYDLIVQPRDSALTRTSDPVRVQLGARIVLCVIAVCAHTLLEGDAVPPSLVLVPVHKWIDGSKRPRGCAQCGEVLRRMHTRPVQTTPRSIMPFWK